MWIGHWKEVWKLMFWTLALCQTESRNCGLCVVYGKKYGATLLVGAWKREKQQNKLVEWKAFIDTVRIDPLHDPVTWYKITYTVEPRFNAVAGDWPNLFIKWRICYIDNLDITNLRGKDQNVCYIEVIVNDWFETQVTSVEIL